MIATHATVVVLMNFLLVCEIYRITNDTNKNPTAFTAHPTGETPIFYQISNR
jgi:hypothetical protein